VVTSLNGEPEKMVTVEAVGTDGEYEEAQSDVNGAFRIRGLLPSKTYRIGIKQQGDADKIERSSPSSVTVTISNQDIQNLEFIAFRRTNKFDVSGIVETDSQHLSTVSVSLTYCITSNFCSRFLY
jgi:hypothetical protein